MDTEKIDEIIRQFLQKDERYMLFLGTVARLAIDNDNLKEDMAEIIRVVGVFFETCEKVVNYILNENPS